MSRYNKDTGAIGEAAAIEYLQGKGYKIIGQNKQISHLEIDILAKFKGKIIFFEVKSRTNCDFEEIEEGLGAYKLKNLKRAINRYIFYKNIDPDCVQLDFLAIKIDYHSRLAKIKHFKAII